MTPFASVQASVAQPFFDAAPYSLTKVERLAEDVGLPGSLISEPKGVISLRAAEHFMVKLDRRIKHPTYFLETLQAGSVSEDASVANIALPRSVTGVEAIENIARRISTILYGAAFLTERDGPRIWLLRTAGTTDFTDNWPVQQYNLEVGLQSVRRVLGRVVQPCALRMSGLVPKTALPSAWRDLPIKLSRRTMGLAFDLEDLLDETGGAVLNKRGLDATGGMQEAGVVSMRSCLETYLGRTVPECLSDSMARAFGMSDRTYRRHLKWLGLSHRQLVSDARLSKAEAMLTDPSIPITEISLELGYTNSPAFTRFFKNRTGRAPQEFRRHLMQSHVRSAS